MATGRRNLTLSLDRASLRKARALAAQRGTSISSMVAAQIERMVGERETYARAQRQAMELLPNPFHLGGEIRAVRESLHERN